MILYSQLFAYILAALLGMSLGICLRTIVDSFVSPPGRQNTWELFAVAAGVVSIAPVWSLLQGTYLTMQRKHWPDWLGPPGGLWGHTFVSLTLATLVIGIASLAAARRILRRSSVGS